MEAGRPLKFKTAEALKKKITEYFNQCDKKKEPYTITGLALALDTNRQTLINYGAREAYADIVAQAKLRCENYAEKILYSPHIKATGAIFALKNYGWKDENTTNVVLPKPIYGGNSVQEHDSNEEDIQPEETN